MTIFTERVTMRTCAIVIFVATLVVSIHCLTDEEKDKVKTIHRECQDDPKTHIDEDILKKFADGEHVDKSVVGAHILCMSSKFGFVNHEGKVSKSSVRKALARGISDEAKLNEAVDKCAVETGDAQDTAIAVGRCIRQEAGFTGHQHHHHH